jgi:aminopeptidase N
MNNLYFDTEDNGRKSFELPGAKPHYNPDRPGQVEHIFLDLNIDITNQSFEGNCTITLLPVRPGVRKLTLNAVDLDIKTVLIDEVNQPFDYDGQELKISLLQPTGEQQITIKIDYQVDHPQRGLYFIHPDEHYPQKPIQVWTQGEDEDSRFWFPCFDYPGQLATSEIKVKVIKPFMVISNGELISREEQGDYYIYHWLQKQVHPTYLMTLAIGDFAEIKDDWQGIPVQYYVEKGKEESARLSMGKTPKMMEFLSQKYGCIYPYPKYAQVCVDDFIFGGMENTSTTLLTDRCLLDQRAAKDNTRTESLVLHELAHQWFGDLVVIKHWSHAWIKEGMASYAEVLWTEYEYGKDDAAYYLLNEARSYLKEDSTRYRRPIVTNIYREAIELYDRHLYEKGACVYHLIRGLLGDRLFDKAIQIFVHDNAHKTVETIDLLRAIDKATGINLMPIFDQYVFRGGHPDFKVAYSWDADSHIAKLTVTQTQVKDNKNGNQNDLFELKIPVAFGFIKKKGQTDVKLTPFNLPISQKEQSFYFPLEKKPDFVSFDVNNYFLKTVSLEYPVLELKNQLRYDPDPISRIYATIALGKKANLEVVKTLAKSLKEDPFWGVRVEVAKQLGKIKLDQVISALKLGLKDPDARVRRAVIEALSNFKLAESYQLLKQYLIKGDPSYYNEAAIARSLGSMVTGILKDKEEEVLTILQKVLQQKAGWNEVVRSGAIEGLSQMKTSPQAVKIIQQYTNLGVPQPLRLTAIRALGAVSVGQTPDQVELILEQLETIATESFFLTQVAVSAALGKMQTPGAIALLTSLASQTPDGRVRRMAEESMEKVRKNLGAEKGLKELREEVDKLKQENQELQSRLAKLEANSHK